MRTVFQRVASGMALIACVHAGTACSGAPPDTDPRVATVYRFHAALAAAARGDLATVAPSFELSAWQREFPPTRTVLEVRLDEEGADVLVDETSDFDVLLDRPPTRRRLAYRFDVDGRIRSEESDMPRAARGGRLDEFLDWLERTDPAFAGELAPGGEPRLEEPRAWRESLVRWRAAAGLPDPFLSPSTTESHDSRSVAREATPAGFVVRGLGEPRIGRLHEVTLSRAELLTVADDATAETLARLAERLRDEAVSILELRVDGPWILETSVECDETGYRLLHRVGGPVSGETMEELYAATRSLPSPYPVGGPYRFKLRIQARTR